MQHSSKRGCYFTNIHYSFSCTAQIHGEQSHSRRTVSIGVKSWEVAVSVYTEMFQRGFDTDRQYQILVLCEHFEELFSSNSRQQKLVRLKKSTEWIPQEIISL